MSYRHLPSSIPHTVIRHVLRDVLDRLHRIETGGAVAGVVSMGDHIKLGVVDVTVVPTGVGAHVNLVFTNPNTGTSSTIAL